ncbi:hypothetical protein L7F22_031815 [Adiantum nelumboides]|nr:hypothetical protein [Adiantum nelumboides]
MMQGDAPMRVRFLVNRSSQKILYMEAGKEFVDMLLGFLQLPVATILSGLRKQADMEVGGARSMEPALGSMSNVYESLRRMSSSRLLVPKEGLLSPPCPLQLIDCSSNESPSKLLQFPPASIAAERPQAPQVPSVVYRCQNNSTHLSYVSWESGVNCKECADMYGRTSSRPMTSAMSIIDSPPASFAAVAKEAAAAKSDAVHHEGGYVQHYLSFIVTDELSILPASAIDSIVLLNDLQVEKLSDLDSVEAVVSPQEALQLLKVSFTSWTALNQVFGSRYLICHSCALEPQPKITFDDNATAFD